MRNKKPYNPDEKPARNDQQRPAEPQDRPERPEQPEPEQADEELTPVSPEQEQEDDEPIGLVDADDDEGTKRGQIKAFGSAAGGPAISGKSGFDRTPTTTGKGAIRCRLFHSKIAEAPLNYMQNQINEWLDEQEIEVKHVGHLVGNLEGKTTEPNMIVMVWY
ncbi:MAG: hypothetical protein ACLFVW_00130 [Phycisphaerae bacterium]